MSTKSPGPEDFNRSRATGGEEDDVEGHGTRSRDAEDFTRSRGPEDFNRSRATGGEEDDVEGHAFRGRSGASAKGE